MARAAKAGKGKGKIEGPGSSHGGGETHAMEEATGVDLAGDGTSELDALAIMVAELQEEDEVGEVAKLEADWLVAGPQAPEPILN